MHIPEMAKMHTLSFTLRDLKTLCDCQFVDFLDALF